jgi:hypothetical protein
MPMIMVMKSCWMRRRRRELMAKALGLVRGGWLAAMDEVVLPQG